MGWPIDQMGNFWAWLRGSSCWLDIKDIALNISNSSEVHGKDSVCIMVGSEDVLMDVAMCRREADDYRDEFQRLRDVKKLDTPSGGNRTSSESTDDMILESHGGVRLVVVQNAGHHSQNDCQRDIGAEAFCNSSDKLNRRVQSIPKRTPIATMSIRKSRADTIRASPYNLVQPIRQPFAVLRPG